MLETVVYWHLDSGVASMVQLSSAANGILLPRATAANHAVAFFIFLWAEVGCAYVIYVNYLSAELQKILYIINMHKSVFKQ